MAVIFQEVVDGCNEIYSKCGWNFFVTESDSVCLDTIYLEWSSCQGLKIVILFVQSGVGSDIRCNADWWLV